MAANSRRKPGVSELDDDSVEKAKDKLRGVSNVDTGDTFDKAWERVYGSKEYRPSWVGKLESGKGGRRMLPPPPKGFERPKPKPIKEEPKPVTPISISTEHTNGIPNQFRSTKIPSPLTIDGKIVPKEKELEKWRKGIECDEVDQEGKPVFNKVVKKTNVKGWMNNNSYWQPPTQNARAVLPPKPKKRERILPPKNQKINKSKYDLVGKFEDKVKNPDLKLGTRAIPKEPELKKWGDGIEIPDNALEEDYTVSVKGRSSEKAPVKRHESRRNIQTRISHPQPTSRNKKWNAVLQTADVPTFFTKNTFWES